MSDKQIETFDTNHLTEKQILVLIDKNKFKYLNPEIISNTNIKACLLKFDSSSIFSQEQQQKLIDSELFLGLQDNALENFDSDLIVKKLNNQSTDKKFMQNESLTKNLAGHNKIQNLDQNVMQKFTVQQIKILSQYQNLQLTNEQTDILLQKNYISYFDANFAASKLTDDQVKKIQVIINDNDEVIARSNDNLCITIDQLIALSNTDKFCHIPASVLDSYLSKSGANYKQLQNLNLENATAEQINELALRDEIRFNSNQINQLLAHKCFSQLDSCVMKKLHSLYKTNNCKV